MGDSIEVSYVGFNNKIIVVSNREPLRITLNDKNVALLGEVAVIRRPKNIIDLHIIDENKKTFPYEAVTIKRVYIDEDGEKDSDYLDPVWIEEKGVLRFYWDDDSDFQDDDGKPLKEAVLRIEVDGYDNPQTIKVKYPKRNTKKIIKFKHDKK